MKLVVGLGNPGRDYERTRHNVGFMMLDKIVSGRGGVWKDESKFDGQIYKDGQIIYLKPMKFMNLSGEAVQKVASYFGIEMMNITVVHDDLDLPLGEYKRQLAKGPKGHNGVLSVERCLGETGFWRVRIGVDIKSEERLRTSGDEFVLANFGMEERKVLEGVMERVCDLMRNIE